MISFTVVQKLPEDVVEMAKKQAAESLYVWSIGYGSLHDAKSHTELALLGLVPTSYIGKDAYLWMVPRTTASPRSVMREARKAFAQFLTDLEWETVVFTHIDKPQNARFARFFGYQPYTQEKEFEFARIA